MTRGAAAATPLFLLCLIVGCGEERAAATDTAVTDITSTTPSASISASAYPDARITRFTALVGKTKETVVQTLGAPTEFVHITGMYTYRGDDYTALMQFYDPERERSLFFERTRGGAAPLSGLILRFTWKPPMAVVLKSLNAAEKPSYMLVSKSMIAWYLQNRPNHGLYTVGVGGVQADGYAYDVFAGCTVPPLTGTPEFNYQTNRTEIRTLTPNSAFDWSRCTPHSLRMYAGADFTGYRLGEYDPQGLVDRVGLDGSEVTLLRAALERHVPAEVHLERVSFSGGELTVHGTSTTPQAIATYVERVRDDPMFREPEVTTITSAANTNPPSYRFEFRVQKR